MAKLDEVFLSGMDARNHWPAVLADVAVLWVGVRCDPAVAAARERGRGDSTKSDGSQQTGCEAPCDGRPRRDPVGGDARLRPNILIHIKDLPWVL